MDYSIWYALGGLLILGGVTGYIYTIKGKECATKLDCHADQAKP